MNGLPADQAVIVRRSTERDVPAMVALACRTLGWEDDDATRAHFVWKHFDNPFGPSDLWVADVDGAIVGLRSFLRWELVDGEGGVWRAARTVDTGTDTGYRRAGIFTRLTNAGLERLRSDGVDVVFNTPNAQSLPANLTLGWEVVGRLRTVVRPAGARGLAALARARTPADRGALPCAVGAPAAEVLADARHAAELLGRTGRPAGLTTRRSAAYLAWRYGHGALHHRVLDHPDATAVFQVRRRGRATEAVIADVFAAPEATRAVTRLLGTVLRETGADYLLGLAPGRRPRRFLPLWRSGPVLTTRSVGRPAPTTAGAWALTMGDVAGL